MLMASQQDVGSNADGVAAGVGQNADVALARMLMASQQGVGQNADGVAAGCWPEC